MNNEEWHEWRRNGIGSSDAAVIVDASPWKTPRQLWEEKVNGTSSQMDNSAMRRGRELEPVARTWFENRMNVSVFPQNRVHSKTNWIRASLDGIDMENKVLVEIKCPNAADHAAALSNKIPEKYIPQVQHQLLVTGLDGMYYCSFDGIEGIIVEVPRDNAYIKAMLEEEQKFWDAVLTKTPPPITDRDFLDMCGNSDWLDLEKMWLENKKVLDSAESQDKDIRQSMVSLAGDRSACGRGIRMSKSECQGTIDYKQIMADHPEIDWEGYRKKPFTKWTFRDTQG